MRRLLSLIVLTALTALVSASPVLAEGAALPKLGLQTWTCRNLTFEQMVGFAVKHQIKYLKCAE